MDNDGNFMSLQFGYFKQSLIAQSVAHFSIPLHSFPLTFLVLYPKYLYLYHLPSLSVENCGRADIVFVFDSSASIGEQNWWRTKQFAIDVMKGLNVGADESRIACVTFSDHATTQWQFGGG
jgi:hypothetical protein